MKRLHRKIQSLLFDKRAISVTLSTLIITAGVIAFGIAVLYWAYSWGNVANQQYASTVAQSQSAIQENIAFEYIDYSQIDKQLTVYLINCGKSNNVEIAAIYIYDSSSKIVGSYHSDTSQGIPLTFFDHTKTSLDVGVEGYFTFDWNAPITQDITSYYYTIRVVTERGRNFDGSFSFQTS